MTAGDDNRLVEDVRYRYFYDNQGRLVRRESQTQAVEELFAWDDRGLLLSFTRHNATTQTTTLLEYAYDAAGRRTGQRVSTVGYKNMSSPESPTIQT